MPNPPKQIPVQSLLSNATSNRFFWLSNEKKLVSNNNYKTLSSEKTRKKNKEKCFKNKRLCDNIYSIAYL